MAKYTFTVRPGEQITHSVRVLVVYSWPGKHNDALALPSQASDRDIISALQALKAICWQNENCEAWSLLDETVLLDSLEHILLTCVEHKLQLDNFRMSDLLAVIQCEDNPLSYEPHVQSATCINPRTVFLSVVSICPGVLIHCDLRSA